MCGESQLTSQGYILGRSESVYAALKTGKAARTLLREAVEDVDELSQPPASLGITFETPSGTHFSTWNLRTARLMRLSAASAAASC
jgi:hypothetical protein